MGVRSPTWTDAARDAAMAAARTTRPRRGSRACGRRTAALLASGPSKPNATSPSTTARGGRPRAHGRRDAPRRVVGERLRAGGALRENHVSRGDSGVLGSKCVPVNL